MVQPERIVWKCRIENRSIVYLQIGRIEKTEGIRSVYVSDVAAIFDDSTLRPINDANRKALIEESLEDFLNWICHLIQVLSDANMKTSEVDEVECVDITETLGSNAIRIEFEMKGSGKLIDTYRLPLTVDYNGENVEQALRTAEEYLFYWLSKIKEGLQEG